MVARHGRFVDDAGSNVTARPLLRRWLLTAVLLVVFLAAGLLLTAAIGAEVGRSGLLALLVAVLPLGIVVPSLLWLDRYEAEPRRYLLFAFLWGALIATLVSLVLNTGSALFLAQTTQDPEAVTSVVVAPVVEESLKGLGVLLILWFRRREFDGVVDGVVYAGLSAAGFAFAENVLYFGRALTELGPEGLIATFILRGLIGPFAHPLFTMWIGIGIGMAAARSRGWWRFVAPVIGLLVAITLHALWNLSAVAGIDGFWTSYLLLQVPVFVGAIAVVSWARWREGRMISNHLVTYGRHGWFTPPEVEMLASVSRRRDARRWAARAGGRRARRAMVAFQDDASELAMLRVRMTHGTVGPEAVHAEQHVLRSLTAAREALPRASSIGGRAR